MLRGASELVVNGRGEDVRARVEVHNRKLAILGRRDAFVAGLGDALTIFVAGLTTAGVLAAAVAAHDGGALDRVLIATLALLALASFDAIAPLPGAARELTAIRASGRRVLELFDRQPDVRDPAEPMPPPPTHAPVALESVTARYAGNDRPTFRRLDLQLEPGSHVALLGPTGSGKTTITRLLLRFLDPEEGRVTIAGHDLREYRQEDVRRVFALAGQDAHVFHATIRANVALGRPEATDGELWDALYRVRLGSWAATLPKGLDTLVGEDGTELSGGQRQRLTLARALLADAGADPRRADGARRPRNSRGARSRHLRGCRPPNGAADHPPSGGPGPCRPGSGARRGVAEQVVPARRNPAVSSGFRGGACRDHAPVAAADRRQEAAVQT